MSECRREATMTPDNGEYVNPPSHPCQRCGSFIVLGTRGYGWSFLCIPCYDELAIKVAEQGG